MKVGSRSRPIRSARDEHVPNGFDSRFTYEVEYYLRKSPSVRKELLEDRWPVVIAEVEPAAAQVAYHISSRTSAHDPYEVRAYRDGLWWPLYGAAGRMSADEFLHIAREEWEVARTILDPRKRTFKSLCPSEDEFFALLFLAKRGINRLNWDDQKTRCERDAARVLFCDRHVYVEAGPPVWYASSKVESRGFDLTVGHSAVDRSDGKYRIPGPSFDLRERCSRENNAYGLDEAERLLWSLGGDDIAYSSDVEVSIDRPAGSAVELCARALVQYLWRIARHRGFDKAISAFHDSKNHDWPPDEIPTRAVLLEFIALARGEPGLRLKTLADDAERIMERWDLIDSEPLTLVEYAALADLAI